MNHKESATDVAVSAALARLSKSNSFVYTATGQMVEIDGLVGEYKVAPTVVQALKARPDMKHALIWVRGHVPAMAVFPADNWSVDRLCIDVTFHDEARELGDVL